MTRSISVLFFGSPEFAVPILRSLQRAFDVRLVVTQPDKAVGRHREMQATAVARAADGLKLPVTKPAKLSDAVFRQKLAGLSIDVGVVAAYGKILPRWLLDVPRHGMVNVHGSLLPAYRGASPIAAAIAHGDDQTGITMMQMNERMDEGDVLEKLEMPIADTDTTATLTAKLSELAAAHIVETVERYVAGELEAAPQPVEGASYTKLLTSQDGYIELDNSPANLDHLIRAYHPWPGVWGLWRGKRVKLLPGNMVQMEGKKPAPLADFKRGYPDFPVAP